MEPLWAKIVSLSIIGVFTLLAGLLPLKISSNASRNGKKGRGTFLNVLLSFSGGVLFATCFIHLIPEVREVFDKFTSPDLINNRTIVYATGSETGSVGQLLPWGELTVCIGFFVIYALEEVVEHFLCRSCEKQHHHHNEEEEISEGPKSCLAPVHSIHGAHRQPHDSRDCLVSNPDEEKDQSKLPLHGGCKVKYGSCSNDNDLEVHMSTDSSVQESQSVQSVFRGLLLVCALSFHSLFEGMAIGLQDSSSGVWNTFIGVAIHKFVLAFCVGIELVFLKTKPKVFCIYIIAFSLMSPIGICIGIIVTEASLGMENYPLVLATLQGLAAGTLLYVTFFEILTKTKGVELNSFINFAAIVLGFASMTGFHIIE